MVTRSSSPTPQPRSLLGRLRLASWRGRFEWLLSVLFVAVLVCWLLARMTPSWYLPLDPTLNSVMDTAQEAQRVLLFESRNTVERVPLGEQRWTITQDEINSLLAMSTAAAQPAGTGVGAADPAQAPQRQ